MTSPTARTLAALRKQGIPAQVVERFCPYSRRRIDLFSVIDIVAIYARAIVGIQVTSGSNLAARQKKIEAEPLVLKWLRAGGLIELHGWRKIGPRGKRKRWKCRVLVAEISCGKVFLKEGGEIHAGGLEDVVDLSMKRRVKEIHKVLKSVWDPPSQPADIARIRDD